ncbi:MAG: hypothetical protein R6X05_13025 [Desulfobacterales bacterium]
MPPAHRLKRTLPRSCPWQDRDRNQHPDAQFFLFAVMDRCRIDEPFRLDYVVMLPIYDMRMTGRRALIKGRWVVLLDGREGAGARFEQPAVGRGGAALITFGEPHEWLRSPDILLRIKVRETVSGWTTGLPLLASQPAPGRA